MKKYLHSITHCPIHVLFVPKFASRKVDSPVISALNITQNQLNFLLKKFAVSCSVADLQAYNLITPVINSFNGDVEQFYPNFYKVFVDVEDPFRGSITRATYSDDVVNFDCDTKFSAKEKSLIAYLSGYVFGAFYRQIRFSKIAHQDQTYHQQYVSFLVAGKCVGETISLPVWNRGGLWKVNEDVIAIFTVAEVYFLSSTKKLQNKIVSKVIVNALMENCMVLESFAKVRQSYPDNIKKDIVFNLLEDLLTLYICVRTFSFVKDKVQAFKIRNRIYKCFHNSWFCFLLTAFHKYSVSPLHNHILRPSLLCCQKNKFFLAVKGSIRKKVNHQDLNKTKIGGLKLF